MSLQCRVPQDWVNDFSLCLYDWQTLVGGGAALGIGFLTIWYIRRQIKQADEHVSTLRKGNLASARAYLPLALVEVSEFSIECLTFLKSAHHSLKAGYVSEGGSLAGSLPNVPDESLDRLTNILRYIDDTIISKYITEIIANIQVLKSRTNGVQNDPYVHKLAVDDFIIQAATVSALAVHLLPYARWESEAIDENIDWEDMGRTLKQNGVIGEKFESLNKKVEWRKGADKPILRFAGERT